MSLHYPQEKINPVRDKESLRVLAVSNKVKQFIESDKGKDILIVIIVILVGLGSFALGRLSVKDTTSGIKIEYTDQSANTALIGESGESVSFNKLSQPTNIPVVSNSVGKSFFASNRGQKYYSIGCSAGKTIKQENRIYFSTKIEAERAGYELSSSCK